MARRRVDCKRERQIVRQWTSDLANRRLADLSMPNDLKEFADRHGLGNLMEVVWMNGFQNGMTHAVEQQRKDQQRD